MRFSEFAATLPEPEHRRLVLAVTTGLHEARLAAQIIQEDGDVEALRERVTTALSWLSDARELLNGDNGADV